MSQNPCPQPTEEISRACAEATSTAELFESLRQLRENSPALSTPSPQVVAEPAPTAAATNQFYEVLYPRGNDRIEISAASQRELDSKKAAILAAYGK